MFGIGFTELLVILVICIIFVGPQKMIRLASEAGKWLNQMKPHINALKTMSHFDTQSLLDSEILNDTDQEQKNDTDQNTNNAE